MPTKKNRTDYRPGDCVACDTNFEVARREGEEAKGVAQEVVHPRVVKWWEIPGEPGWWEALAESEAGDQGRGWGPDLMVAIGEALFDLARMAKDPGPDLE